MRKLLLGTIIYVALIHNTMAGADSGMGTITSINIPVIKRVSVD